MNVATDSIATHDVARTVSKPPPEAGWSGGFCDLRVEHGFVPLDVDGALPPELEGTFYRNGPGRFGVAGERYRHWFDGDGAVSAVRMTGGKAFGAAKLVRTAGMLREQQAGRRLFGSYDTPMARPLREIFLGDTKNPANTSVLLWQSRLFATCEAGKPYEVSTDDLSTVGETDLGGAIGAAFSAHPHYVPQRRCTYNFGIRRGRKSSVDVYALPDDGAARRITTFTVDGTRMNHDFAVSERHAVFVFAPAFLSLPALLFGKGPTSGAKWRPERGAEIVVVPLDDPEKIIRFTIDACMLEHSVNAFEEGGKVYVDYIHYASPEGLEGFARGLVRGRIDAPLANEVRRLVIDPTRRTAVSETLLDRRVELPRVADRVVGARHRFVYYAGFTAKRPDSHFDAVVKHDLDTGAISTYAPGRDQYPSEAVFVARPGAAREDDGWLLTLVYDAVADASRLDVLDARRIDERPVASCRFEQPIPLGFHGLWAPAAA